MTPLDAIRHALDAAPGSAKGFQAELASAGHMVVSAERAAEMLDAERSQRPVAGGVIQANGGVSVFLLPTATRMQILDLRRHLDAALAAAEAREAAPA